MGLLNKIKNMFTEEVEVEVEPIKKEVIQVEIPAPAKQEKKEIIPKVKKEEEKIVVTDSPALKKEEKSTFPMFFDDDFEVLDKKEKEKEKQPKEKKEVPKVVEKPVIPPYGIKAQQKKEEKKIFKPTPIISPVYGILDKDYRKEDLTLKKTSDNKIKKNNYTKDTKELTIDDIRNKAYGTLEDEIKQNMGDASYYLEDSSYDDANMFDNFFDEDVDNDASIDELLNKELYKTEEDANINNDTKEVSKGKKTRTERLREIDTNIDDKLDDIKSNDIKLSDEKLSNDNLNDKHNNKLNTELEDDFKDDVNLNDSDLLNMIDSMYQEGDE